ncbi:MAG: DUF177 domain-containing protein [Oscillospiraceae bacterium]|nr:DUF177 domain-containing protein [Oscillospiraceae bacterium]
MLLQLRQLFNRVGDKKELSLEIPLEELGDYSIIGTFITPISLNGQVMNRAGVVTLDYTMRFTIRHLCDRCLNEFDREYVFDLSHILVKSVSSDNDEYIVCPDSTLDLNELAISDLLLQLPTKVLCKEDCKGLCLNCGKDLNDGDCGCCG